MEKILQESQVQEVHDKYRQILILQRKLSEVFMKLDNECTIIKFTFLIDPHNIITSNITNHIIYISNSSTKQI